MGGTERQRLHKSICALSWWSTTHHTTQRRLLPFGGSSPAFTHVSLLEQSDSPVVRTLQGTNRESAVELPGARTASLKPPHESDEVKNSLANTPLHQPEQSPSQ